MEYVFLWFVFSIVAGAVGSSRKIGFWATFLLSLILSPLIGFIAAFASKQNSTIEFEKKMMQNAQPSAPKASMADEIASLERSYLNGDITVYQYEERKATILNRYN